MVSNLALVIFACALVIITAFSIWSMRGERRKNLLHRLYLLVSVSLASWIIVVMCMRLADQDNEKVMFVLDCLMQPGGALCSPLYLCIAVTFVEGYERMRTWMKALFIMPVITVLVTWTNPLHHLQYVKFSVVRSEIEFVYSGKRVMQLHLSDCGNYLYDQICDEE